MLTEVLDKFIIVWGWVIGNIFYINIVLSIFIVFFQRREPRTVWAWLLVLYFIPILGFVLYLFLGQDHNKRKMFKTKEIEDILNSEIRRQENKIINKQFKISDVKMQGYSDLILYNLDSSRAIYGEDNTISIYTEGKSKFADLIDEINNAKEFIHIQYYIIRDDELFFFF